MGTKSDETYDYLCFGKLAYEFSFCDPKEAERKIKHGLRYYKLGKYNQERVEYIRALKNDLFKELSKASESKYFISRTAETSMPRDFDFDRLKTDYLKKYDMVSSDDMGRIINFSIYIYYLR